MPDATTPEVGELVIAWSLLVDDGYDPDDEQAPCHPGWFRWMRFDGPAPGGRLELRDPATGEILWVPSTPGSCWMRAPARPT